MSSLLERQKVLAATLVAQKAPLAEILTALGITVPDQDRVKQMMAAIRLGLPENSSSLRIQFALLRKMRAWRRQTIWHFYEYDKFVDGSYLGHRDGSTVPQVVQDDAERIRSAIPGARLFVHALKDDPWLEVRLGYDGYFIRGWFGDRIII